MEMTNLQELQLRVLQSACVRFKVQDLHMSSRVYRAGVTTQTSRSGPEPLGPAAMLPSVETQRSHPTQVKA